MKQALAYLLSLETADPSPLERSVRNKTKQDGEREHWAWVTKPEFYLEKDGSGLERSRLDPASLDSGGWWSCHKDTRQGDLVVLYRTAPKKDIGYLIQVTSNAFSLADDEYAASHGWRYGCEYEPLFKFERPLTRDDLKSAPDLEEWGALRKGFQGSVFRVPDPIWQGLMKRAAAKDPTFKAFRQGEAIERQEKKHRLEAEIEERIHDDPSILQKADIDIVIEGRQIMCGTGGRIDLLGVQRGTKRWVVIEIKVVRAGRNTFGQISEYLGWIGHAHPRKQPPLGIVIADGFDNSFIAAARTNPNVRFIELSKLGL